MYNNQLTILSKLGEIVNEGWVMDELKELELMEDVIRTVPLRRLALRRISSNQAHCPAGSISSGSVINMFCSE